jgi:hypothetical protein
MNDADGTSLSLAGNPARLVRKILDVRDTDRPQCKVFKLQLACYVLDAANLLPRTAIAAPLGKSRRGFCTRSRPCSARWPRTMNSGSTPKGRRGDEVEGLSPKRLATH